MCLALGASGRSALQELKITAVPEDSRLRSLAAALPGMPCLACLYLMTEATDDLLNAVDPCSAPSLREITTEYLGECAHAWLHRPAVLGALAR